MRSSWSSEDDQLTGPARLTVAVRWRPGLTVRCGTRMARPGRPALGETCLAGLGAWSSGAHARSAGWVAGPRPPGANMASGAHGTAGVEEKAEKRFIELVTGQLISTFAVSVAGPFAVSVA